MRKILLLVAMLLLFASHVFSQTRTITGTVTDESGRGVPDASVMIKGTSTGTITNDVGAFTLGVPANRNVLIVSGIGLGEKEVTVGNQTNLSVVLKQVNTAMDEVIVTAYGGAVRRDNFVGSAAQVTATQIQNRPLSNPLNALVGAAPGIQTTMASGAPGSSPGIIMRGIGSFTLSSEPLYVVDGAVYDAGFSNINPQDIESITALKDASTTALYGSRASNGVVMITTKKGSRGRQTLSFRAQTGVITQAIGPYSTVNAQQYYPLAWEAYRNGLQFGPTNAPKDSASLIASGLLPRYTTGANTGRQIFRTGSFQDIYQVLGNYNPFNVGNTAIVGPDGILNPSASLIYGDDLDWIDQGTRRGTRNEYGISYTAGAEKSDLGASVSYLKEKGWGLRSDLERFTGRINVNTNPTKWFKTGFNLSANRSKFNNASTGGIVNLFYFGRYIAPIYPVSRHVPGTGELALDALGQPQFDFGNDGGYARPYNSGRHAIAEHLWNKNNSLRDVISARAYGEVIFTSWLKFVTNISTDITNVNYERYENPRVGDGFPSGRYSRETERFGSYTFNQLINFNNKYGLHNIDAMVGHENYQYGGQGTNGMRIGQSFDNIYVYENFGTINSLTSSITENRMEAYLSRVNYDFDNKYLFSASFRRDGNSKFPAAIRWANFWSAGLGWRIERENFFQVPWVDLLKLRASYGETGNAGTGNYPYQGGYTIGYDDDTRPGVILTSLGSPDLTWESAEMLDMGVDFSLFKNRLSGTIGYFIRNTSGLIFSVPQPLHNGGTTGGAYTITQNIGNMGNKGIEVQLTGAIVRNQDVNWSLTLNATSFKNKIKKMPALVPSITSFPFKREEGRSYYDFFTRTFYGVDPDDGQVLYLGAKTINSTVRLKDNSSGGKDTLTIDHNNAVESYIGKSSIPDLFGSIVNNFSYRNFDLSFTFTYQLGGWVYDGVYAGLMSPGTNGTTYHTDILNRWQNPGDVSTVPRLDNLRTAQYGAGSTRFIISGTYLSLNNVSLGYKLPKTILNKINATNVRVYISGENVAMLTKRKGMNVNGNFSGTTGDTYDAARVLSAGINFNF